MINKFIYLLLLIISKNNLQAMTLYDFNNNKLNFKTTIFMLKGSNVIDRRIKIPNFNFIVSGKGDINDKLSSFVLVNTNFNINNYLYKKNLNLIRPKIYYFGIKNRYGSLSFGKNYGVIFNVDRYIDIPTLKYNKPVNFMLYKSENVLTYKNKDFLVKGLSISIQKQFENKENNNIPLCLSTRLSNGDGHGFSTEYKVNDFIDVSLAYSMSKRTIDQIVFDLTNISDDAVAYSLGFRLDTNKFYISSTYGETYNITPYGNFLRYSKNIEKNVKIKEPLFYGFSERSKNVGLIAKYKFNTNLIPSIGYFQSKVYMYRNFNNHDIIKYFQLGLNYKLKYAHFYADYKVNLMRPDLFIKRTNTSYKDIFNLGFNINF